MWKCPNEDVCIMNEFVCDTVCGCEDCSDDREEFCHAHTTGFSALCPGGFLELHGKTQYASNMGEF